MELATNILQQLIFKKKLNLFLLICKFGIPQSNSSKELKRISKVAILFIGLLLFSLNSLGQTTLWTESFSSTLPAGWAVSGANVVMNNSTGYGGSGYYARVSFSGTNEYLYTKTFTATAGNTYNLSYIDIATGAGSNTTNIYVSNINPASQIVANINTTTSYINGVSTQTSSTGWTGGTPANAFKTTTNWTCPTTGTYFFVFKFAMSTSTYLRIDEVSLIETAPACTPPTTAPSGISFSNVACTITDVSWSGNGNGDRVLVVAKASSSTLTDPSNAASYTASTTFGSGSQIGIGNYVVYNGDGSSPNVSVTGLTAGVSYNYAVYSYNSTSNCYNLNELTGSQSTSGTAPSTQTSALTFANVRSCQMDIGWTRGNGNRVLVVARSGGAVNADPTNGSTYTANANFGSGSQIGTGNYVIYDGTGTGASIFTLTGLNVSTTYNFALYEYETTCGTYNLIELTGSQATSAASGPTNQATSGSTSNITCTSMDVSWTRGTPSGGNKVLVIARSGAVTDPAQGSLYTADPNYSGTGSSIGATGKVVYDGTGTTVNVTGLTSGTAYTFDIYEYFTTCNNYNLTQISPTGTTTGTTPTVSSVTSSNANATYKIGDVITITITFSAAVTVTGTPQLQLETGTSDQFANYVSGTGTTVLTFSYTVQSGDVSGDLQYIATNALSLNGGTINSACGSPATLTLPNLGNVNSLGGSKAIVIDGTPPTVTTYSPADNSTTATTTSNLVLTFSENVVAGTGGNIIIYNSDGTVFETIPFNDPRISYSTTILTINPTGTFVIGASYYVQISNNTVRDNSGNFYAGIANSTTWNFTIRVPQIYYVNNNSTIGDVFCSAVGNDAAGRGTTAATPKLTLTSLLSEYTAALVYGDTIKIDAGTYNNEENFNFSKSGITFLGAGYDKTIIDDQGAGTATNYFMYITGSDVTIKEMTIKGYENNGTQTPGHSAQAVTVGGSAQGVLIENVILSNNGASGGNPSIVALANTQVTIRGGGGFCNVWKTAWTGGIEAFGNNIELNIENYIISYNFKSGAYDGGGLYINNYSGGANNNMSGTVVNVSNTLFYNNEASDGGAISQRGGTLNVTDCVIQNNMAGQVSTSVYGGGLRMTGGTATFTRVKFTDNKVGSAGGTLRGGAIGLYSLVDPISLTLNNCYFSGNIASEGNDLFADVNSSNAVTVSATNTTFSAGNYPIYNKDASITLTNCGNPTVDPAAANSPAVNKVNTTAPSSVPNPSTPNFTGTCATAIILPVELSKFSGRCMNDKIRLTWQTLSEQNNDNFEIERSEDAINYYFVGRLNGNGTTNSLHNYNFYDYNTENSTTYYYRLKQNDYNGNHSYSSIIQVEANCNDNISEVTVYPNPSQSNFNLEIPINKLTKISVEVYNELGQTIKSIPEQSTDQTGTYNISLDMSEFSNGVYFIKTLINSKPNLSRIIKF